MTVGDIFTTIGGIVISNEEKKALWGAKNLTVIDDPISKVDKKETEFIKNLNNSDNLTKLENAKVPIHAVATTFKACDIYPVLCLLEKVPEIPKFPGYDEFKKINKLIGRMNLALTVIKFVSNDIPSGLDEGMKYIFNGETNDLIVPKESMEAGLISKYTSVFEDKNIMHIDLFGQNPLKTNLSGVTGNSFVNEKLFELLKQNFNAEDSETTTNFTKKGIGKTTELSYAFLPNFKGFSNDKRKFNQEAAEKIVIDPNSFTLGMSSGDEASFDVYQENLDKIIITYDYPNLDDMDIGEKTNNITFKNTFVFEVPKEFLGDLLVTAYGFNKGKLVAMHSVKSKVQIPQGVTLQSIYFSSPKDVEIYEKDTYAFDLLGTFSDGVERRINDLSGVEIIIENLTILESVDVQTLKALTLGETTFKAKVGLLTTSSINIKVEKNPVLYRSLITNFYPEYEKTGPIKLNWETYHEYESKHFTLERSENNDQNFVEINRQLGRGIFYEPTDYRFVDNTDAKHVFYRLRLYDINDQIVYTQVIKVDKETLSTIDENLFKGKLSLVPNPLKSSIGSLFVQSDFADKDATLNIYDISGRFVYTKKYSILQGNQKIDFEIPSGLNNGVYLVQLKTINYAKTLKLILQR